MEKKIFQLGVAADWEYDMDFIRLIKEKARSASLNTYVVWPENLDEACQNLLKCEWVFRFFFDRASASSPQFLILQNIVREQGAKIFDPVEKLYWVSDKATMHLEFMSRGLLTPYTIILPPFEETQNLNGIPIDLSPLGRPFIIKPATMTGGSLGVVADAESLEDVLRARKEYPHDKYLLQRRIEPKVEAERRFWFRVFYSWGLIQVTWWNDLTHVYSELKAEEIEKYLLWPLFTIMEKIRQICELQLFSSEIVQDVQGDFIVVDYVNESCDMRLQSLHFDGVPDPVVENIASSLINFIKDETSSCWCSTD